MERGMVARARIHPYNRGYREVDLVDFHFFDVD